LDQKNDDFREGCKTIAKGGAIGTAGGAGISALIGGVGIAAMGTAVVLPIVAVGAGLGIAGGGCVVLGRRMERMRNKKNGEESSKEHD